MHQVRLTGFLPLYLQNVQAFLSSGGKQGQTALWRQFIQTSPQIAAVIQGFVLP